MPRVFGDPRKRLICPDVLAERPKSCQRGRFGSAHLSCAECAPPASFTLRVGSLGSPGCWAGPGPNRPGRDLDREGKAVQSEVDSICPQSLANDGHYLPSARQPQSCPASEA